MALVLAGVLLGNAQATSADQYTDKINAAKRQQAQEAQVIASLKAKIAAAQNNEAQLQGIISSLDSQIATKVAQVASAKVQLAQTEATLAAAQVRLAAEQSQYAAEKRQLSKELVVIYELQQQSTPLKNLMTTGNFNEFWTNLINSRRISNTELATAHQVEAKAAEVQSEIQTISAEKEQRQADLDNLQATQDDLTQQLAARQQALSALAAQQARDQQQEQAAEAAQRQVDSQIAHLIQEQLAAQAAAAAAGGGNGHFVWPDSGPITQGFGCTTFPFEPYDPNCPAKHFHSGLDIAGPCGATIVAADAGVAYTEAYQASGYGNYIIIVHSNGWYTLYGHMSGFAIGNGQTVGRGQRIG